MRVGPRIFVSMPLRNAAEHLPATLTSLRRQILPGWGHFLWAT